MSGTDHRWQADEGAVLKRAAPLVSLKDAYSISAAIIHLRHYLDVPQTVSQALALLRQLESSSSLYRLYRRYFPQEWACSTASMQGGGDEGYTCREREFLQLVERHLFPLDSDYLLDLAAEGARTEYMLLLPYAMRWYDEPEDMAQEWQLLLLVSGGLTTKEALHLLFDMEETLEAALARAIECVICDEQGYSLTQLMQFCAQCAGPLAYLALTFSLMFYHTGNEWLDVHGEDGAVPFDHLPLRWCEEHIDLLSQAFREAQDRERRAQTLADWLKTDINHRMWNILEALEQAKTSSVSALIS